MSGLINDLSTWVGKARSRGQRTITLDVDEADAIVEMVVDLSNKVMDLEHELRTRPNA